MQCCVANVGQQHEGSEAEEHSRQEDAWAGGVGACPEQRASEEVTQLDEFRRHQSNHVAVSVRSQQGVQRELTFLFTALLELSLASLRGRLIE